MADAVLRPGWSSAGRDKRQAVLGYLQARKLVDASAIARAELVSAKTGQPVEQVLNQLGALSDETLVQAYADVTGGEIWDPLKTPIEADLVNLGLSSEYLRQNKVLILKVQGRALLCAACDPLDNEALSGIVFATGRKASLLIAKPSDWRRVFDQTYRDASSGHVELDERRLEREIDQVSEGAVEGAGARVVAAAFEAAVAAGASDIHFEPRRHDLKIRLRIDGRLVDYRSVSADLAAPTVSRVKVIANLNLGERRLPQDGRTSFVVGGKQVDVRVATSPSVFGESAVLRILDRTTVELDLDKLGLAPAVSAVLREAAKSRHGMFLITGPTGSGKTTTLYSLLQIFANSAKKVLSVEDPVEYHFEHVSQTQVAPKLGLTFAAALRSFLRQDPDVILVGEIRDPETAAVAVQAAMTGHLVLASVHANDALAVLPRLRDMGLEPYQLAAGFKGAAAQRLVRRLCVHCRRERPPTEAERVFAMASGVDLPPTVYEACGCLQCKQLGFRGRTVISEAFLAPDELLRAVADARPSAEIAQIAKRAGLASMVTDGMGKVAAGLTTFEEILDAVNG